MLQVKKKTPRTSRHGRRWMLLCAVALLAGCLAAYGLLRGRSAELPERDHSHDGGVIASHQVEEVVRLSVTTTHGAWTLLREAGGGVTLENDEDFEVDEQVAEVRLCGLTDAELREHSHFPDKYYGQPHFLPAYTDGEAILRLNRLRTKVREAELACCRAFADADGKLRRVDILQALNRLSSLCWILMIRCKAGKE